MNRNQELEEKLPFYALAVLDKKEMDEIDAYIKHFPDVAKQLKEFNETAELLPYAAEAVAPPPSIKLAIKNHARQNPHVASATVAPAVEKKKKKIASQPAAQSPTVWDNVRDWWQSLKAGPALPVALALSLLAVGWFSTQLLSVQNELDLFKNDNLALADQVGALTAENNQLEQVNLTLLDQLEGQQQVVAYAADSGSRRLAIPGTDAQPSASGGLFIRPDTGELLLVISQLEPLTEAQIYQLWLIEDQPVSAGLIAIQPDGTGIFEIDVALDAIDFAAVGVSIEPAGGSQQPTGDIVMFAEA